MKRQLVRAFGAVLLAFCATTAAWAQNISELEVTHSTSVSAVGLSGRLTQLTGPENANLAGIVASRIRALVLPFDGVDDSDLRMMDGGALMAMPSVDGDQQWRCLTEALYFEARGESIEGQYAVAEVILNRVDHAFYPDTICEVITQGTGRRFACQFTYTCNGRPEDILDEGAWHRLGHVARIMIEGAPRDLTAGATHYHAAFVNPRWASRYTWTANIGIHHFYRQQ